MFDVPRLLFTDTPTTETYTLSLHDALPISTGESAIESLRVFARMRQMNDPPQPSPGAPQSGQAMIWFGAPGEGCGDRKSTRLNSSHANISYAVFCLKKKTTESVRAQHSSSQ